MEQLGRMGKNVDASQGKWEAVPEKMDEIESDENDLADRFEDFEKNSEEVRVFGDRLKEIEGALLRMKDGTYGTCSVCGKKIEPERLEANPAAATCMEHLNG